MINESPPDGSEDKEIVEPTAKKSKQLFCTLWKDKYLWLNYDGDFMYCLDANKKNSYTSGCKNFCISDIQKHALGKDHRSEVEIYAMKSSEATVPIAFQRISDEREEAILAALKNVYWLAKEDVASLKYNSLNELVEIQSCKFITNLYVGKNAKYTSPDTVKEMQQSLPHCIKSDIQQEVQKSPFFGIMVDESTDIFTTKALTLYSHHIVSGIRKTRFLAEVKLDQCDALAIMEAIEHVFEDYNLDSKKCLRFGSDGASVMTGKDNGVAALMKRNNPYLISVHCVAYRLALASSQAAEQINAIVCYQKLLSAIYSYFSHSTLRTEQLTAIQKVLDEPEIKLSDCSMFDGSVLISQ